jgi:phage tail sheath protein FI
MVQVSYPGVYIQEIPSGVHTITGVATSITAFVGRAVRGDVNEPVRITSYGDYVRIFGGLSLDSSMSYAVQHFFQNGGADALIVRVYHKPAGGDGVSVLTLGAGGVASQGTLTIAVNPVNGDKMKIDSREYIFDDPAVVAAQGKLTITSNPAPGDKMIIGTRTYNFKAASAIDGDITIGADVLATRTNIVGAINHTGAAGTSVTTAADPSVTAGTFAGNDLLLTAKTAGAAGNTIPTTSTFAVLADNHFDDPKLGKARPGADAGLANTDGSIFIGSNLAATQANIVAAINRTGLPGTQYATATVMHPTVAAGGAFASNQLILSARTVGAAGDNIVTMGTFAAPADNHFDAGTLGTTTPGGDSSDTGAGAGPQLVAANPGAWGRNLRASVDLQTRDSSDPNLFNLEIREIDPSLPANAPPIRSEKYLNLSVATSSALFVDRVLENRSKLVRVGVTSANRPDPVDGAAFSSDGDDGLAIVDNDISDGNLEGAKHGLWALEKADLFNLLCIPPLTLDDGGDIGGQTRSAADAYCTKRRAFFVVDPLSDWDEPSDLTAPTGVDGTVFGMARSPNSALFFPRVVSPDPLRDGQLETFVPCGVIAGVMARTDAARGVWKAPAGIEATLSGVSDLSVHMTDGENGQLNPLGINCLRSFPVIGRVNWGARTLEGADQLASEWKYVPIRRLALMMEESLFRGTKWVVFEPNDEPLWANIRLNVGAYMMSLFRQGAFQGTSPKDAYFVKCDAETTTQNDRDNGIVNILVGFAPLKPAEFVVIGIQQIAGQL